MDGEPTSTGSDAPVLIGVGAAFDFHAGAQAAGAAHGCSARRLEWLFRLATEPRRLWRRYLVNNPQFVILIARQLMTQSVQASKRVD